MIDYSNGYPVQVTTKVTKNTPWNDVFKMNGNPFKNWSDDGWRPSNWENIQNDPHCEDYKNVFVKLKTSCSCGHIYDMSYFDSYKRFIELYKKDKNLRKKIDLYIEMTNDLSKKPTNKFKWKFMIPIPERTEFGKKYYALENELIRIFSKI